MRRESKRVKRKVMTRWKMPSCHGGIGHSIRASLALTYWKASLGITSQSHIFHVIQHSDGPAWSLWAAYRSTGRYAFTSGVYFTGGLAWFLL